MTDPVPHQMPLFQDIALEEYAKGKDELTLAEFPLALAGKNPGQEGKSSVSYHDIIRDKKNGQPITRTVTIEGSEQFGLPTYYDEEVLFGVLQLTNLQRHGDHWPTEVRFSRYHLAKVIGLKTDGRTYRRLWDSLHRLANTTYNFHYAFFDKSDQEWRPSVVITFIQTLIVHGGVVPGKNGDVTVRWNQDIHRNFQAGYLRDINFLEYRELGIPLAKALYRFLGKHFYRSARLQYDLRTLAHEKLGLSRSYNIGQIKRALGPALERLEEINFIKPALRHERYQKIRAGEWRVILERATNQEVLPMEVQSVTEIESKLIEREVSPSAAAELVGKFPEEVISQKIDEFDFLIAKQKDRVSNKGGFLASSIREAWSSPAGYETPEERERREKEKEAKRKAKVEKLREKRRREAERKKIDDEREDAVNKYLAAISEEEHEALKLDVVGENPDDITRILSGSLVRIHVAEMLESQGKVPPLPEEA